MSFVIESRLRPTLILQCNERDGRWFPILRYETLDDKHTAEFVGDGSFEIEHALRTLTTFFPDTFQCDGIKIVPAQTADMLED